MSNKYANIQNHTWYGLQLNIRTILPERHRVHGVEHRVTSDQLVVELIVARRGWQEGVPVGHKQVENDHNLGKDNRLSK